MAALNFKEWWDFGDNPPTSFKNPLGLAVGIVTTVPDLRAGPKVQPWMLLKYLKLSAADSKAGLINGGSCSTK